MNEWLYDELAQLEQAKQGQTTNDNRLTLLQQQTAVLWNDLTPVLQDAVEKLNTMSEFRKLTGGLSHATGLDRVEIKKHATLPALELAVGRTPMSISLEYTVFKSPRGPAGKPKRETLEVDLDEGGQRFLKTDEGTVLTIDEAVRRMLRPFLHPELLA